MLLPRPNPVGDGTRDHDLKLWRRVELAFQIARDILSASTLNTLAAILALFLLIDEARHEVLRVAGLISEQAPQANFVPLRTGESLPAVGEDGDGRDPGLAAADRSPA